MTHILPNSSHLKWWWKKAFWVEQKSSKQNSEKLGFVSKLISWPDFREDLTGFVHPAQPIHASRWKFCETFFWFCLITSNSLEMEFIRILHCIMGSFKHNAVECKLFKLMVVCTIVWTPLPAWSWFLWWGGRAIMLSKKVSLNSCELSSVPTSLRMASQGTSSTNTLNCRNFTFWKFRVQILLFNQQINQHHKLD